MFLWGIANELIHVAYNYLLTSISTELHDLTYPIFETGIVLFAIMAWACALMPLVIYNGSRRKLETGRQDGDEPLDRAADHVVHITGVAVSNGP